MNSKTAKFLFQFIRLGGLALIHILPIFLITYTFFNLHLLTNLVIYAIFSIFDQNLISSTIQYAEQFFLPLALYLFMGVLIWALIVWPAVRKYFPPLFLVMDGVELREGRVWWRSPNKLTHILKKLADTGGIKYEEQYIWLYRSKKLINPFKPLASLNKLYFPDDDADQIEILSHVDIPPKKIVLHDVYIMKYRDGYILSLTPFQSRKIDTQKLDSRIKEDAKKISEIVGDYALTNADLRVKNVSSALFWVPPANLEIKEHLEVGSESVAYQILEQLLEQYDENKKKALKDGVITEQEISSMLLPMFNQILLYVNSMKAKFGNEDLPEPPELRNNLITMQQIDGYINEVKAAMKAYYNPEVFKR